MEQGRNTGDSDVKSLYGVELSEMLREESSESTTLLM